MNRTSNHFDVTHQSTVQNQTSLETSQLSNLPGFILDIIFNFANNQYIILVNKRWKQIYFDSAKSLEFIEGDCIQNARNFKRLTSVHIIGNLKISCLDLKEDYLLSLPRTVKKLIISGCNSVTYKDPISNIWDHFKDLKFLAIKQCYVNSLASANISSSLKVLDLSECESVNEFIKISIRLVNLKVLRFGSDSRSQYPYPDFFFSSEHTQQLTHNLPKLEKLILGRRVCLSNDALCGISSKLTQLRTLSAFVNNLIDGTFYSSGLNHIAESFPNLVELDLNCNGGWPVDSLITLCRNATKLSKLNLSRSNISTEILEQSVINLQKLTSINLTWCRSLDDDSLEVLSKNLPLRKINVSGNRKITDIGIRHLCINLSNNLQKLIFKSCPDTTILSFFYVKQHLKNPKLCGGMGFLRFIDCIGISLPNLS